MACSGTTYPGHLESIGLKKSFQEEQVLGVCIFPNFLAFLFVRGQSIDDGFMRVVV
jgi:hypothetical protein